TPFIGDGVDKTLHIGYRNVSSYTFAQYADDIDVPIAIGPVIGEEIHPPNRQEVYLNGSLAGSRNGANYLLPIGQATIGRGNDANFHGDIAEVIVYSTNLTADQRVAVENYLYNKWLGQFSSGAASSPFFVGTAGQTVSGLKFVQQPTDTT